MTQVGEQHLEARALEWRRTGDQLEQEAAQCVEIGACVDRIAMGLLG